MSTVYSTPVNGNEWMSTAGPNRPNAVVESCTGSEAEVNRKVSASNAVTCLELIEDMKCTICLHVVWGAYRVSL